MVKLLTNHRVLAKLSSSCNFMDKVAEDLVFVHALIQNASIQQSYSQTGEDVIIRSIFNVLKIDKPTYIDIGAFDPRRLSNTALFYEGGCRGINVEPNPLLFREFLVKRREDVNLNIGIHKEPGELDYFVMDVPTLNTFSRNEAENNQSQHGHKIVEVKKIKVDSLKNVLEHYCAGKFPDYMDLDAEGVDEVILESIDYLNNYPKVICLETVEYSKDGSGRKNDVLIGMLKDRGYDVYADTHINTIFVKREALKSK